MELPAWLGALPPPLLERCFPPSAPPRPEGAILVWLQQGLRAREQATLDVALSLGNSLGRPVWVAWAVEAGHAQSSDRHARFVLEGWEELHQGLLARGLWSWCHLDIPHGPAWRQLLPELAADVALVVTDAWPMAHAQALQQAVATRAPLLRVDSACVVPMPGVGQAFDRAFSFRMAIAKGLEARIARPWVEAPAQEAAWRPQSLPGPGVLPLREAASEAIARGKLDHGVGPVPGTPGGSQAAIARWEAFLKEGLPRYAADRNDPLRRGVSAMSPYLHQGMIPATQLAREAQARGGAGAEKYLDELIIWRELAFAWCHFMPGAETWEALPAWAQQAWEAHLQDRRVAEVDLNALDAGEAPHPLWNAAQRGLRRHGHLHNNLRMTWGKALPAWRADPKAAYRWLQALNHRHALDGQDPASIGGLAWCMGAFDGPHPEHKIWGRVRPRPLEAHARRLEAAAYASAYAPRRPQRVAVLGAGPAGLLAARILAEHGLSVQLVDKGRRVGGRGSTRAWPPGKAWDHGVPFLLEASQELAWWRHRWAEAGLLTPWGGRLVHLAEPGAEPQAREGATPWVGQPSMGAWWEALGQGLPQALGLPVTALSREEGLWRLHREGQAPVEAEALVLALPGPQASPLLRPWAPAWAERCPSYLPTWALLAEWEGPLPLPFDAARVAAGSPLSWLHREGSRPGRGAEERWVLHASHPWSQAWLEAEPEAVQAELLAALAELAGEELPPPSHVSAHRWRYAAPMGPPLGGPSPWVEELALALAGDAWGGPSLGAALISGQAAAGRVLDWAARQEGASG